MKIADERPEVLVLLGDSMYLDCEGTVNSEQLRVIGGLLSFSMRRRSIIDKKINLGN